MSAIRIPSWLGFLLAVAPIFIIPICWFGFVDGDWNCIPIADAPTVSNLQNSLVQIQIKQLKGGSTTGSGFIASFGSKKKYIVTNQHVISAPFEHGWSFTCANGQTLEPTGMELAPDQDLARIHYMTEGVDRTKPLFLASAAPTVGRRVFAFGDPMGMAVFRRVSGKIKGIGADKVEVTCEVVSGMSGGPVVDAKTHKVVGVVTDVWKAADANWVYDGTEFSQKSRPRAERISATTPWERVPSSLFFNQSRRLVDEQTFCRAFLRCLELSEQAAKGWTEDMFHDPGIAREMDRYIEYIERVNLKRSLEGASKLFQSLDNRLSRVNRELAETEWCSSFLREQSDEFRNLIIPHVQAKCHEIVVVIAPYVEQERRINCTNKKCRNGMISYRDINGNQVHRPCPVCNE